MNFKPDQVVYLHGTCPVTVVRLVGDNLIRFRYPDGGCQTWHLSHFTDVVKEVAE